MIIPKKIFRVCIGCCADASRRIRCSSPDTKLSDTTSIAQDFSPGAI
jgi:hypothetical protein